MTSNQLAYLNLVENRRANMARESEVSRSNTETERANRAREGLTLRQLGLDVAKLDETTRSNKAREGLTEQQISLDRDRLSENVRHNIITEGQQQQQLDETVRANREREKDTDYSNATARGKVNSDADRWKQELIQTYMSDMGSKALGLYSIQSGNASSVLSSVLRFIPSMMPK